MTDEDPHRLVARGYDLAAEAYGRLEGSRPWPRTRWLRDLLSRLPPGSRVLDLGCGSGMPATQEIARNHRALGVDVSSRQIELARSSIPEATFLLADALSFAVRPASLGAVVSLYVFDHLPRGRHAELLARIRDWLRPGGLLLFTAETEDQPGSVSEWLGVPMFFNSFDSNTTLGLVERAGFELIRHATEMQLEGEREVPFLWILARNPPSSAS